MTSARPRRRAAGVATCALTLAVLPPLTALAARPNQAPRITKATVTPGTSKSGRVFDALLTICDDSLGIYEGGTPKGPGYLVKQQWLYRRMKLIAFARETETYVDFRPGCFRFHVGWLPSDRFQGPGSYVIRLAVRDPEGRPSNTIVRIFKFATAGKP